MPIPRLVDGGGGEVKGSAHWPRHRGDVRSRVPVAQMIAMDHNGLSETFFPKKRELHIAGFFHTHLPKQGDTGGGVCGEPRSLARQVPDANHHWGEKEDTLPDTSKASESGKAKGKPEWNGKEQTSPETQEHKIVAQADLEANQDSAETLTQKATSGDR